jgi:hypothetical protein
LVSIRATAPPALVFEGGTGRSAWPRRIAIDNLVEHKIENPETFFFTLASSLRPKDQYLVLSRLVHCLSSLKFWILSFPYLGNMHIFFGT